MFQLINLKFFLNSTYNNKTPISCINHSRTADPFKKLINIDNDPFIHSIDRFNVKKPINLSPFIVGKNILERIKYNEQDEDIPENRFIIRDIITKDPGITLREIQRTAVLAMGVVQYHLNYLEKNGIITLKLGRCKHFYPREFSSEEKIWLAIIRNENIKKILDYMKCNGNLCRQKDIVVSTGISKVMVSYYIRQLEKLNVVERNIRALQITEDFSKINNT